MLVKEDLSLATPLTPALTTALASVLAHESDDETLYRALVAAGTLGLPAPLREPVKAVAAREVSARTKECVADLSRLA